MNRYEDIECPYCGEWQEIDHDDGYGYQEDKLYEQMCNDCDKTYTYTTSIMYHYEAEKADCLNDGKHKYKPMKTCPRERTRMYCITCYKEREPTEEEWKLINSDM